MKTLREQFLPTREISYNYCVTMYAAQQLESDLRHILDSAEYYGLIDEIELTKYEKSKYKDSTELIDNATCGRLLTALKQRIKLPSENYWKTLKSAIKDRNFLAHKFLLQFDYGGLTKKEEKRIVDVIYDLFLRMWKAVGIVRALKKSLDEKTDRIDSIFDEFTIQEQPRKKGV